MNRNQRTIVLVIGIAAAVVGYGCGGSAGSRDKLASVSQASTDVPGGVPVSSGTPAGGGTVSWPVDPNTGKGTPGDTGGSGATGPGVTPYSFKVRGVGYTSTSFTVRAGKVLKVRFAPGVQDSAVAGSNYSPQYSGMGVYVEVGTVSKPTEFVRNGLGTGTAERSSALDFSTAIAAGCSTTDTTCRQDVTVTITKPNYDHYCYTYGQYCQWTHVYDSHPWNGTITVQTDDTQAI